MKAGNGLHFLLANTSSVELLKIDRMLKKL